MGKTTINEDFNQHSYENKGFIGQSNHGNHPPIETKHSLNQMDLRDARKKSNVSTLVILQS